MKVNYFKQMLLKYKIQYYIGGDGDILLHNDEVELFLDKYNSEFEKYSFTCESSGLLYSIHLIDEPLTVEEHYITFTKNEEDEEYKCSILPYDREKLFISKCKALSMLCVILNRFARTMPVYRVDLWDFIKNVKTIKYVVKRPDEQAYSIEMFDYRIPTLLPYSTIDKAPVTWTNNSFKS